MIKKFADLLSYNPETGRLMWAKKPSRNVRPGTFAGTKKPEGYVRVKLGGDYEYAHRIAWYIMTGEEPPEIDHKNGIRDDNRWGNLRAATRIVNAQNLRTARRDNKSTGLLGVYPNHDRFMARIVIDKAVRYLGTFDTPTQAHEAYLSAKRQHHEGCTI